MNKNLDESKVSVDLSKPTSYSGKEKGKLYRFKMWMSFFRYKTYISRYGKVKGEGKGSKIAEIGSGPGYLLSFLQEWFPAAHISSIEYDPRLVEEGQKRAPKANVIQGNAEKLTYEENSLDAVISLHVIEHLFHPEEMVKGVFRSLKPGGVFIVATPNLGGNGAKWMGKKWSGYRHDHVALKTSDEWSALILSKGFVKEKENTTFFSSIPILNKFPLVVMNWGLLFLFGSLPWKRGEAFLGIYTKP